MIGSFLLGRPSSRKGTQKAQCPTESYPAWVAGTTTHDNDSKSGIVGQICAKSGCFYHPNQYANEAVDGREVLDSIELQQEVLAISDKLNQVLAILEKSEQRSKISESGESRSSSRRSHGVSIRQYVSRLRQKFRRTRGIDIQVPWLQELPAKGLQETPDTRRYDYELASGYVNDIPVEIGRFSRLPRTWRTATQNGADDLFFPEGQIEFRREHAVVEIGTSASRYEMEAPPAELFTPLSSAQSQTTDPFFTEDKIDTPDVSPAEAYTPLSPAQSQTDGLYFAGSTAGRARIPRAGLEAWKPASTSIVELPGDDGGFPKGRQLPEAAQNLREREDWSCKQDSADPAGSYTANHSANVGPRRTSMQEERPVLERNEPLRAPVNRQPSFARGQCEVISVRRTETRYQAFHRNTYPEGLSVDPTASYQAATASIDPSALEYLPNPVIFAHLQPAQSEMTQGAGANAQSAASPNVGESPSQWSAVDSGVSFSPVVELMGELENADSPKPTMFEDSASQRQVAQANAPNPTNWYRQIPHRFTSSYQSLDGNTYRFACTNCGEKFRTGGQRTRHINRKHNRRYKCIVEGCEASFCLNGDLARHENSVHSMDETWSCTNEHCSRHGKPFSRKDNFDRHVRKCIPESQGLKRRRGVNA